MSLSMSWTGLCISLHHGLHVHLRNVASTSLSHSPVYRVEAYLFASGVDRSPTQAMSGSERIAATKGQLTIYERLQLPKA